MLLQIKRKYEAMGFVEALIAIAVAGIACVVLMSIAMKTISQVMNNETADSLTEQAIKTGESVKMIATLNNNSSDTLFPQIASNINSCFAIDDSETPFFPQTGGTFVSICNYADGGRNQCRTAADPDTQIFRVFCITDKSDSASGLVVGKIVTGLADCDGSHTSGKCSIPDYEYNIFLKVIQKS